jgi:hypothetical protein
MLRISPHTTAPWIRQAASIVVCAGLVACSSIGPLEHRVEWADFGTTAVLKCSKSPTGFCHFVVELTNFSPVQVLRVASGGSTKVALGSQGALYCVSETTLNGQECKKQVLTGGFHYGSLR